MGEPGQRAVVVADHPLDVDDAGATAELVDAACTAAGFPPRPRTDVEE